MNDARDPWIDVSELQGEGSLTPAGDSYIRSQAGLAVRLNSRVAIAWAVLRGRPVMYRMNVRARGDRLFLNVPEGTTGIVADNGFYYGDGNDA